MALNGYDRMKNALDRKPIGEIPYADSLWGETYHRYVREGFFKDGDDPGAHFGMSYHGAGWINCIVELDTPEEIVEETDETRLVRNGNRATLRWHKQHSSTPEHVDFYVQDRATWEEFARPKLLDLDMRRIDVNNYRHQRKVAREQNKFFTWSGIAPFEQMHPLCGHEYMLMGMALEPEWVTDMVDVYTDLTIRHLEALFAEAGDPDGMFFYEDMGFKERPFMSPAMYEELVQPGHAKLFDWAHKRGLKVMVHSCGFVEPLVPGLIDAGMDCLQAMEVKAGMDLPRLFGKYGDRIAFMGGFDVRELISNDRARIRAEFERAVVPVLAGGGGYILHSDHSIPPEVDHDTLRYFFDYGVELAAKYR